MDIEQNVGKAYNAWNGQQGPRLRGVRDIVARSRCSTRDQPSPREDDASVTFRQVEERKRLSAYVAEQVLNAIQNGVYAPGDRLPPERALAEQMSVSRNSVREALSALELSNILEARVGSGTYVKHSPTVGADFDGALQRADIGYDLMEIWEAHRELDIAIVGLAADRATSRDYEALTDISRHLESAATAGDVQEFRRLAWKFRKATVRAAGNGPLEAAQAVLHRLTEEPQVADRTCAALQMHLEQASDAYAAVLLAMRLRDNEAASDATRQYYSILMTYLAKELLKPPIES